MPKVSTSIIMARFLAVKEYIRWVRSKTSVLHILGRISPLADNKGSCFRMVYFESWLTSSVLEHHETVMISVRVVINVRGHAYTRSSVALVHRPLTEESQTHITQHRNTTAIYA